MIKTNRAVTTLHLHIMGMLVCGLFILLVLITLMFPIAVQAQSHTPTPKPAQIVVATPGSDVGRASSANIRPVAVPVDSSDYAIMAYTATQNALTIRALMEANATQSAMLSTRRAILEGDFATQSANALATDSALTLALQQANALTTQQANTFATQSANVLATTSALTHALQQVNALTTQQADTSATQSANVLATASASHHALSLLITESYSTQEALMRQQAIALETLTTERDTLLADLQFSEATLAEAQATATELVQLYATEATQAQETFTRMSQQLEALNVDIERLNTTINLFSTPIVLDISAQTNGLAFQLFEGIYEGVHVSTTITWGTGADDDYCGLVVLAQDPSNYYTVELDRRGTVRVYGYVNATWEAVSLAQSQNMNVLEKGSNGLDVMLIADEIQVWVNDEPIINGQGLRYTSGRLGFMGGRFNNNEASSSCRFSDTQISVP